MCFTLPVVAMLSLPFAPLPFPKRAPDEAKAKAIFGAWSGTHRLEIAAGRLTYGPGPEPVVYDLTIDPTAKPATYHISHLGTNDPRFLGIYRIDGDTLTLCYRSASDGRPAAFAAPPGGGVITEVYKRVGR
jgi:uncharacterized protein (TIGR03067 family)